MKVKGNKNTSLDQNFLELIKKGGINFIFYGLNLAIVYLIGIFITKYYGAATYGRYSIIKALILVIIIFNTLGLNTYAIKLSSNKNHYENGFFKSNFILKSYKIIFFVSLIFSCIIFFLKKNVAIQIFGDKNLEIYFQYFPLILILSVFLNYNSNVLKGQGRVLSFSFVSSFCNNFIFIGLILLIFNYYSSKELYIILSLLFSFFIALIISITKIFPLKFYKEVKSIRTKNILRESFPMMLSSSMIFIIFSLDTLMLGFFDTSENVGVYRIVTQVSSLNAVFLIILNSIVGPKISNFYSDSNYDEIKKVVINASKIILFITLPVLIFILFFSTEILLFFGEEYLKAKNSILILSICQFFYAISGFVDLILNMTGKQKVFSKITMFSALVNIILNLILIPIYSIDGASIATGFSILITNILGVIYVKRSYNFLPIYLPFINKTINEN
ncbi:polysaccharide biosynthesis C-terminal domain-containing protein [uncultured Polaribacter sp.]|uniref:oligosaccharide flippase family protein n=1 Tax=uncultured Polaribacter sp. TaxID=174711 RepID=UPI00263075BC|nr:polysaccharide biosynthesis C-terminal domain-containing protein [uncultured Polaribacter sp.]